MLFRRPIRPSTSEAVKRLYGIDKASKDLALQIERVKGLQSVQRGERGERGMMGLRGIQGVKGDKGEKGDKGDMPIIDYDHIVRRVKMELIKELQPKETEYDSIANVVLGKIRKNKIKVDDVEGLNQTIQAFSSQVARGMGYVHGGGDTVDAGTGISISTVGGKKVITNTVTGLTKLTATGTVNSVNTSFTFISAPSYIVSDGLWYTDGNGYTLAGLTAALDVPPTSFIFGIA